MQNELLKDTEDRMNKCMASLKTELSKIRTGRAHPSLLEHVKVLHYGNETPINQVANVAVESSRSLTVTPWEKDMVSVVEKAIQTSDLGLNPSTSGNVIRVPLPQLTEERRRDLVKVIRDEGEKAKVAVRNIRRDANSDIKNMLKEKEISEDDEHRSNADIQKVTDKIIEDMDKVLKVKETDLLEI